MESRTEKITVSVTPSEKMAAEYVAAMEGVTQSELLHRMSVAQVVELFEGSAGVPESEPVKLEPANMIELETTQTIDVGLPRRGDGRYLVAEIIAPPKAPGMGRRWTLDLEDPEVVDRVVAAVSAVVPLGVDVKVTGAGLALGPVHESALYLDVDAIFRALVELAEEEVPE